MREVNYQLQPAVKALQPDCTCVAVQAKGAPAMVESFHAGRAIEMPAKSTADGLICRVPAERALAGLLALADPAAAARLHLRSGFGQGLPG